MFNIRKSKGTIVTKSVLPSAKTGRQLASSLLENVKLQEQLEALSKEQPLVGSPITPDMVKTSVGSEPTKAVQPRKVDLAQTRIESRASVMSELDRKAKESQVDYSPTSRFIIRDNLKPLLATGCPDSKIQNQIADENTKLMAHGKKPFTTYESWVDAGDSLIGSPEVTWNKYVEPVLAVSTAPAFIVRHEYYVLYENGVCYYLSGDMALPSILKRSSSENISAQTQHNESVLVSKSAVKHRDLTKAEYDSVVASQPSKDDLFKLYVQFCNDAKVRMDVSKAVPAWSKD
jgi:hypothetical protein